MQKRAGIMHGGLLAAALACGLAGIARGAFSEPTAIRLCGSGDDRAWMTAHERAIALPLKWPEGATGGTLAVSDANGTLETIALSPGQESAEYALFSGAAPADERVLTFTATYICNAESVAETARVAVTRGAFGPVKVDTAIGEDGASRFRNGTLIPFDSAWAGLDGAPDSVAAALAGNGAANSVSAGASGWLDPGSRSGHLGFGLFTLAMDFIGGEGFSPWTVQLVRYPEGAVAIIK